MIDLALSEKLRAQLIRFAETENSARILGMHSIEKMYHDFIANMIQKYPFLELYYIEYLNGEKGMTGPWSGYNDPPDEKCREAFRDGRRSGRTDRAKAYYDVKEITELIKDTINQCLDRNPPSRIAIVGYEYKLDRESETRLLSMKEQIHNMQHEELLLEIRKLEDPDKRSPKFSTTAMDNYYQEQWEKIILLEALSRMNKEEANHE